MKEQSDHQFIQVFTWQNSLIMSLEFERTV